MKTQKLLLGSIFLFLTFSVFSQEAVNKDSIKLTYTKTKELFLEVLDSLKKENSDVLGTFTINKNPITIKNDGKDFISAKEAKIYSDLLAINKYSKKENKERKKVVEEYFKKKIDSLNAKKIDLINSIKTDTLKGKESITFIKKQLEKIEEISKQINNLKNDGEDIFNKFFKEDKFSKKLIDFIQRKKIWLVDNVEIEIKEGFITDILVTLIEKNDGDNKNPEKRYFTNRFTTSLAFFNSYSIDCLKERGGNKNATIQLFDVLNYQHKMGKNFTPNDRVITITRKEGFKDLTLDNNLDSFLDFRIYSDFLGLVNETPNGIINFETSSKIIIYPKKLFFFQFFKSITPFLRYSRFDNDNRKAYLNPIDSIISRKLDLEQKSFLSIGATFNVFEFKLSKELPVTFHIPFTFKMNITEVGLENDDFQENNSITNTLVYTTGANADFKRINNFGLKLGLIYEWYDQKSNSDAIKRINTFNTIGISSELYYYNPKNINSAFFIRFRTNRLFNDDGLENYAAVQFGYKSTLNFSSKNKK